MAMRLPGDAETPQLLRRTELVPLGECVPHASVLDLPSEELKPDDSSKPPSTEYLKQSKLYL